MASIASTREMATSLYNWAATIFSVLWLTFLYTIFGFFVVFSFSAYQLQFTIQSAQTADNKPLGLWAVLQMNDDWQTTNNDLASILKSIDAKQKIVGELNIQSQLVRDRRIRLNSQCAANLFAFHQQFLSEYIAYVSRDVQCDRDYFRLLTSTGRSRIKDFDTNPEIKKQLLLISTNFADFAPVTSDETSLNAKLLQMNKEISAQRDAAKADRESINSIFLSGNGSQPIGDFLNSLVYLETIERASFLGFSLPDFSQMPPDMLTIILVMAMGAIGGTIHLTRIFLYGLQDGDDGSSARSSAAYYLFRPFLGSITALSVFILAKAGVIVISTPTPTGEGARISPYFISFLGIISGLLAEQALSTIQRTGTRWFATSASGGVARWAFRLGEHFGHPELAGYVATPETTKKLQDICTVLGIRQTEVMEWMREEKPVPPQYQKIISAFLNVPERELFTDIKLPTPREA